MSFAKPPRFAKALEVPPLLRLLIVPVTAKTNSPVSALKRASPAARDTVPPPVKVNPLFPEPSTVTAKVDGLLSLALYIWYLVMSNIASLGNGSVSESTGLKCQSNVASTSLAMPNLLILFVVVLADFIDTLS